MAGKVRSRRSAVPARRGSDEVAFAEVSAMIHSARGEALATVNTAAFARR